MIHKVFSAHIVDNTNDRSVATRLRRRRFLILLKLVESFSEPVSILDIGGTIQYWEMMTARMDLQQNSWAQPLQITLLNLEPQAVSAPNFTVATGDGRDLSRYHDQQFDIVFSNSTIEHVGSYADQMRMAQEVRRVGRGYCIQTPNRRFPIEPHFVFPFFQFLPVTARVWLVQRFSLGWYPRLPDRLQAEQLVNEIRLLNRAELERLFPGSTIIEERFWGLVKSFIVYSPIPKNTLIT